MIFVLSKVRSEIGHEPSAKLWCTHCVLIVITHVSLPFEILDYLWKEHCYISCPLRAYIISHGKKLAELQPAVSASKMSWRCTQDVPMFFALWKLRLSLERTIVIFPALWGPRLSVMVKRWKNCNLKVQSRYNLPQLKISHFTIVYFLPFEGLCY